MSFLNRYKVLVIYILVLVQLLVSRNSAPAAPAPLPVPEPECFPIKPTRRPLPTFSGPVVTVTANGSSSPGQFDFEILNAAPDTTIQLDGSQGRFQPLSTTFITRSMRITSLDPSQPAVILGPTGATHSLRIVGQTQDTTVLIDNVIILFSNAGSGDRSAIFVVSGQNATTLQYTPDVYVDNVVIETVRSAVLMRGVNLSDRTNRIQVTNSTFQPLQISPYTTFSATVLLLNLTDDCFVEDNVIVSQRLSSPSLNTANVFFLFQMLNNTVELTDQVNITVSNNRVLANTQLNSFIEIINSQLYTTEQPNFNLYVYDNKVTTRLFANIYNAQEFSSLFNTMNMRGNQIEIVGFNSNTVFPFLTFFTFFPITINIKRFDTQFYLLDNEFTPDSSWSETRALDFQPAIAGFDTVVSGFQKSAYASIVGQYQGFTSIACANAQPRSPTKRARMLLQQTNPANQEPFEPIPFPAFYEQESQQQETPQELD